MARRAPGWWYPWIFVAGMLLVVVVNGVMIALAIGTFPGLQTEDAYRKGLAYNETIAAAEAQAERGWQMRLQVDPAAPTAAPAPAATAPASAEAAGEGRTATLSVRFIDRHGQPVSGLDVQAYLIRPTVAGHDVALPLAPQGAGVYAATVAVPLPGVWDARIHARRGDASFQQTQRIVLP
jgi:nitrogen fixation protein FixH